MRRKGNQSGTLIQLSTRKRTTVYSSRCEELRVIWGRRGNPGTVAPFRAWRGSRDLVAQSPKFHAPAVRQLRDCMQNCSTAIRSGNFAGGGEIILLALPPEESLRMDLPSSP